MGFPDQLPGRLLLDLRRVLGRQHVGEVEAQFPAAKSRSTAVDGRRPTAIQSGMVSMTLTRSPPFGWVNLPDRPAGPASATAHGHGPAPRTSSNQGHSRATPQSRGGGIGAPSDTSVPTVTCGPPSVSGAGPGLVGSPPSRSGQGSSSLASNGQPLFPRCSPESVVPGRWIGRWPVDTRLVLEVFLEGFLLTLGHPMATERDREVAGLALELVLEGVPLSSS